MARLLDGTIRTRFGLGFLAAYAVAGLYFALLAWATNPKLSVEDALAVGVAWPVQVGRMILDADRWRHRSQPIADDPCAAEGGAAPCGLG